MPGLYPNRTGFRSGGAPVSNDAIGSESGTASVSVELASGGIQPACSANETESYLQGGGASYWTLQALSRRPVQFPTNVFSADPAGSTDPLNLDPSRGSTNLPASGPAGSWCRANVLPPTQDDPFATRALWLPAAILLVVAVVIWLSRGVNTPV